MTLQVRETTAISEDLGKIPITYPAAHIHLYLQLQFYGLH